VSLGASLDEWSHFDFVLGLGANLLPCVPASPDVKVAEGSALAGKIGKIPSMFNGRGEAHGLTGWQKREIEPQEVAHWARDRRLNLCVRTGPVSGVYAFDIDIDDPRALEVAALIEGALGEEVTPARIRENSSKKLMMFRMEETCKKRKIKLDDQSTGPAIELLAQGQQFVACGTHASGARYRWHPELPSFIPTLTLDRLNSIWTLLTQRYATTTSTHAALTVPAKVSEESTTEVLTQIDDEGWQRLLESLRYLLDKVQDNDSWSECGYALLSLQSSGRPAEQLWLDFSRKAVGYEPGAAEAWWQAHKHQAPRTDWRHILNMARQRGLQRVADPAAFPPVPEHSDLVDVVPPEVAQPARRVILLGEARFAEILDELEEVLNPHVYTQGAHLVRTTEAHNEAAIQRSADALMLIPATRDWARKRFGQLCDFKRYVSTREEWTAVAPPAEHVNAMLGLGAFMKIVVLV
jgi:hypothetical protein